MGIPFSDEDYGEDVFLPDEPDDDLSWAINEEDRDRPIDQIYCTGCGRPMVIWADEELKSTECARCRSGLTPEWEY
jgi:hypothetical protein